MLVGALLHKKLQKTAQFEQSLMAIPDMITRYRRVEQSKELAEMLALEKEVQSVEFQTKKPSAKEIKKHPELWTNTEDGQKERRLAELKKDADILFYQATKLEDIERYESYKTVYQDDFDWSDMTRSDWKAGFHYASKNLMPVHSHTQGAVAMNNGKNVETHNSQLMITTRKEKVSAPAWNEAKGMVMREFNYTSDVIHNTAFSMQQGVIQVKARACGKLHHSIYLTGENQVPVISIMDCCRKRLSCNVKTDAQDTHAKVDLGCRIPNKELIFTLVITPEKLVWYINNMEVHSMTNRLSKDQKYYLHMGSFGNKKQIAAGELHVDWVRVYTKK